MTDIHKRIENLEKQVVAVDTAEEWLITYPGGTMRHVIGTGEVTKRNHISVVDERAAELTLWVLQGHMPGEDEDTGQGAAREHDDLPG